MFIYYPKSSLKSALWVGILKFQGKLPKLLHQPQVSLLCRYSDLFAGCKCFPSKPTGWGFHRGQPRQPDGRSLARAPVFLCRCFTSSPFLTERCTLSSQMWEKAIELGKQLAKMHESHMFDFMELSQLLVRGHVQFNSAVNRITIENLRGRQLHWSTWAWMYMNVSFRLSTPDCGQELSTISWKTTCRRCRRDNRTSTCSSTRFPPHFVSWCLNESIYKVSQRSYLSLIRLQ